MKSHQVKAYKAKKDQYIHIWLLIAITFPIFMIFLGQNIFIENPIFILPLLIPAGIMCWGYFDTSYFIKDKKLYYRCGFLKGNLLISDIREIEYKECLWSGIRPALARNGLLIKYRAYEELYVAPVNNEQFIGDLLEMNKSIEIHKKA